MKLFVLFIFSTYLAQEGAQNDLTNNIENNILNQNQEDPEIVVDEFFDVFNDIPGTENDVEDILDSKFAAVNSDHLFEEDDVVRYETQTKHADFFQKHGINADEILNKVDYSMPNYEEVFVDRYFSTIDGYYAAVATKADKWCFLKLYQG